MIPPAHLAQRGLLNETTSRPFPLKIVPMPSWGLSPRVANPADLVRIVEYLKVETSARYRPAGGQTFCNVYAYDYCYCAGVFLPRVWWNSVSLGRIEGGAEVKPIYGTTVYELNANALFEWLRDDGPAFGWRRIAGTGDDQVKELQDAANAGQVCVISAIRKNRKRSGHIGCVIPEGAAVLQSSPCVPVQSQAGVRNFCASVQPGRWWLDSQFEDRGFFVHD